MTEANHYAVLESPKLKGDYTEDTFLAGKIRIRQPKTGYRFSLDAPILAYSAAPRPGEAILDLGTGCGVIPLILGWRHPDIQIYGVEIQDALAALAQENVDLNGFEDRIHILCSDMKTMDLSSIPLPMDMVVSNPPYRRVLTGRINPDRQRAVARHEVQITLVELLGTVRKVLKTGGRLMMIYSTERMAELFTNLANYGMAPKMCRTLHTYWDAPARICLVEAVKGAAPGLHFAPPLIFYKSEGVYTNELQRMFIP